ncbi:hypothetical protein CC86DRAFT_465099 [Ophiobolus disseminans]|uniref:Tautomerase cis-CaaD-like domain-containing protein n=1 Tax=Ophiobolus disseminans TaxID=1469910 RepID=A0A6A7A9S9_9PLEO|nr:hypothetical protein CC86DRAFT_465099 [Ophiobolus disseminans]
MPHYEIHHICGLDYDQKDQLATDITNLHCTLFSTPSAFVNVSFQHHPPLAEYTFFVGGKRRATNFIHAHLRPRGPDNAPKLQHLVREIMRIWDERAHTESSIWRNKDKGKDEGRLDDHRALHNVFIYEDVAAGAEQGFVLPVAGQEGEWVQENIEAFKKRAEMGDESVKQLLLEVGDGLGKKEEIKEGLGKEV